MPNIPQPGGAPGMFPGYVQAVIEQIGPECLEPCGHDAQGNFNTGTIEDPAGIMDQRTVTSAGTPAKVSDSPKNSPANPYKGMGGF